MVEKLNDEIDYYTTFDRNNLRSLAGKYASLIYDNYTSNY